MINQLNSNKIILISIFVVVVYGVIISVSDTKILFTKFSNVNLEYLLIALGLFSLGYFVRSFRWIAMLRFMQIRIPILQNIVIYFTGYAFSLTPAKVGESIRSKYLKDDFKVPITQSLPTVLAERYYDVIGVLTIIFVTVGMTEARSFMVYVGIGLLVFFYFAVRRNIALRILSPLSRVKKLRAVQHMLMESIEVLETLLKPKIFFRCTFLTIVSWTVESIGACYVFKGFHLEFGFLKGAFDYVTTSLAGAATLLPGGVGGTEVSLIGLLLMQNHSYDEVLGPILMIRFFALWYVIIIGIVFTSIYKMNQRRTITNG